MKTVFTSKQVDGLESQCSTQATTQWHIVINMKYTDREAAVIKAFISSLLDAGSKEVNYGKN